MSIDAAESGSKSRNQSVIMYYSADKRYYFKIPSQITSVEFLFELNYAQILDSQPLKLWTSRFN